MSATKKKSYHKQVQSVQGAFLDQVRREMARQKINQSELSRRTDCTRAYISLVLDNNHDANHSLNLRTAIRIADALGMNVSLRLIKGK